MPETKWIVEITGDDRLLKELPILLRGPDITATLRDDGGLVLSGAMLDHLTDPDIVVSTVSELLPRLSSLLHLYAGAESTFTVKNVFWVSGGRLKQRVRAVFHVRAISRDGLEALAQAAVSGPTLAASVLRLSTSDNRVAHCLDLLGGKDRGWYELYDLIDAMGNVDRLVKRGWTTRAKLSAIRQTANHYRHRGSQARTYRLPAEPPAFNDARTQVLALFDRWLKERLSMSNAT